MILFLDTETTGLYPGSICQLSYVMQERGKAYAKNFFFSVDYVEPSASAVHGLTVESLEKLSDGKDFSHFVKEIEKDFLSADIVCAHNSSFDFSFLRKEFERTGRDFFVNAEFCTMKNSVSFCALPRNSQKAYKYPKLVELCAILGITDDQIAYMTKRLFGDNKGFHDARFDTTAVFLAVNNGVEKVPSMSGLKEYL